METNQSTGESSSSSVNFTFKELASATGDFCSESTMREGTNGRVYRGCLPNSGQLVAVKKLDPNGLQSHKEFLVEILMLSTLHHQNLITLIGYCAEGSHRLVVYEFMPQDSLEEHLFVVDASSGRKPLDWNARIKIAVGVAEGLEYLQNKASPPVNHRNLKSSNIMLDDDFNPKLSEFGLAKLGPIGKRMHISTLKSDVYSFGVVLLELITGRRATDIYKMVEGHDLASWVQSLLRDPKQLPEIADPLLQGEYTMRGLNQAISIAAMCLQEAAADRLLISDVATALDSLLVSLTDLQGSSAPSASH